MKKQLLTFLAVGLLAVATDSFVYLILGRLLGNPNWAKLLSFVAGSVVAYLLNRRLTFAAPRLGEETLGRFASLYFCTLCLNVFSHHTVLDRGVRHLWPRADLWAFGVATALSTVANFLGQKYWVFVPSDARSRRPGYRRRDYLPFVCLLVANAIAELFYFHPSFLSGEMWAEEAINYFFHAHYAPLSVALQARDAGYLPLLPRLVAQLVQAFGVPVVYVPYAYACATVLGTGIAVATPALPQFRRLIPADLARVILCLALALHPDFELRTFINFSYYMGIPLFFCLVRAPLGLGTPRTGALLGCFAALVMASKAFFMGLAPAFGLLLVWALWQRRRPQLYFAAGGLGGFALQAYCTWQSRPPAMWSLGEALPYMRKLGKVALGITWLGPQSLPTPLHPGWRGVSLATWAVTGVAVLCALLNLRHRRERRLLAWPLLLGLVTVPPMVFLAVYPFAHLARSMLEKQDFGLLGSRVYYLVILVPFLCTAIAVARGSLNRRIPWALALWLLVSFPFHLPATLELAPGLRPTPPGWTAVGHSAWQAVAPQMFARPQPRGCIPIDPYPWVFGHDCGVLEPLPEGGTSLPTVPWEHTGGALSVPPTVATATVDLVGIRLHTPGDAVAAVALVARDAQGKEIARAPNLSKAHNVLSYFYFAEPLHDVATVEVIATSNHRPHLARAAEAPHAPQWIWYGRPRQP